MASRGKESQAQKILIIYTGGTIGMIEDPATGALRAFDFDHLLEQIPEIQRFGFQIVSQQFDPPIDSSAITVEHWLTLASIIEENYSDFDGFVVLHGTDTMAYSASALSFLLEGLEKAVVFTGSQLPVGRLRTDGKENLITAIQIAAEKREDGSAMVPEVCIFFDASLKRANRTIKCSADQFDAFASYNYPSLAHAGIHISYQQKHIHRYAEGENKLGLRVAKKMDPNVAILKLFPGIEPSVVDAICSLSSIKAIVMETYGSGNATTEPWFLELLSKTISRGVIVVNITQCASGMVDMQCYNTGIQLRKMGVVSGYDMTTEAAVTKLMYLLGQGYTSQEVARLMELPFCGELTASVE